MSIVAPTAVYRFFDSEHRLIYVGVTDSLGVRWGQHARRDWWPRVDRYTLHWHEDRADAIREEAHAISHEDPTENIMVPVTYDREFTLEELRALPTVNPHPPSRRKRREKGRGGLFQRTSDGLWVGTVVDGGGRKAFASKDRATAQAKMDAFIESRKP